ncbi:MAG: NAD(P)/FAD-dependent oxidoreductase [Nannocystaceae bacterium]|nr:tryptophan 7-halogenase [Myxococcales bacterium]
MTIEPSHDVIVIGGGPAGSTAAALLARAGRRVLLFEKEKFPREHVGESLLPFCYGLFEELGVIGEMRRRFVRKPGVRFVDRTGEASTTWCFNHVLKDESHLSFQVIRGEFDQLLLENARRLGADAREQVAVTAVDLGEGGDGPVAVTATDADGATTTHHARFVIDASGRDAFLGSKNGWRQPRAELDRTALWSHWGGVKLAGGLEEGLSLIIYMGEEKKGWIWVFPLSQDRITAGVVMQNAYIRDARRALKEAGSTDWKHDLCLSELRMSNFVRELIEGKEMLMPVQVNGNYSYEIKRTHGDRYALIGDARGFIDPIFSSGVFLSMKTAKLVAEAVQRKLDDPAGGMESLDAAYKKVQGGYNFVHRMIQLFYSPHSLSWAHMGADGSAHRDHEQALAAGHYMLSGDFFENYEKYHRFFDLIADKSGFERYKRLVIDRDEFIKTTCNASFEEVFGALEGRAAAPADESAS